MDDEYRLEEGVRGGLDEGFWGSVDLVGRPKDVSDWRDVADEPEEEWFGLTEDEKDWMDDE